LTPSWNLIEHRWIPVVDQQFTPGCLSLRELLLQAHTVRAVQGDTPLETAALLRFILAVLYRVVDLEDEDAWAEQWQAGNGQFSVEAVDAYLLRSEIHRQFDLFGPGPRFFQYPPDPQAGVKSINSLIPHFAFGNNATLFDHHCDDEPLALTPAAAARALLAMQVFGLGQLSGREEQFTDGPGAKGILFMVTGTSLFQTLMLNLVPRSFHPTDPSDCPIWEQSDPFADERTMPNGVMDILTWPTRRIWLEVRETPHGPQVMQMRWSPGLRLSKKFYDEPMKLYTVHNDEGISPLKFDRQRALWRNSATIFRLAPTRHEAQGQGPLATQMLGVLHQLEYIDQHRRYHLLAFGIVSKLKKNASIEFMQMEELPLRIEYLLHQQVLDELRVGLALAEEVHSQLTGAVMVLARGLLNPTLTRKALNEKPTKEAGARASALAQSWHVSRFYWSRLGEPFGLFVDRLPDDAAAALTAWQQTILAVAKQAFNRAEQLARPDDRSFRAITYARARFYGWLTRRFAEKPVHHTEDTGGNQP
jgi:CRISPR system Cascade subunit CasA